MVGLCLVVAGAATRGTAAAALRIAGAALILVAYALRFNRDAARGKEPTTRDRLDKT